MSKRQRMGGPAVAIVLLLSVSLVGCGSRTGRAVERPVGVDQYVQGVLALRDGDRTEAIDNLQAAVELNPELRMAHGVLGDIYRETSNYDSALPHYEAVLDLDPLTLTNYYKLGVTYQMLRRLREAADTYVAGLAIDEEDLQLNLALGQVYLSLQDVDLGLRYLERATRIDPDAASAWSSVGVAHDLQGNYLFAEASYRKAVELEPDNLGVRQNLAANLLSQGRGSDARRLLEDVLAERDSAQTHKLLGDALRQERDFAAAEAAYDEALQRNANYVPALNGKGLALIGQYEDSLQLKEDLRREAVRLWEDSLARRPAQPAVVALLDKWSDDNPLR